MIKRFFCTVFCLLTFSVAVALPPQLEASVTGEFDFYGFKGYEMGGDKIVCPADPALGNPWVLRARFWGIEPQVDTALLGQGFYVVYCDVADLYGAPKAVARYDKFYIKMREAGLNEKVVLEGFSRGGLIVYNWAASNVDKVAAIYADAPVMDIKSWPMGKSSEDTHKMMQAYGFSSLDAASAWRGNPVDHAAKLKEIPIIHVVGQADDVVPVTENTDLFKQRLQDAGGRIVVIRKQGVGHHPHSLKDPTSIVDFILVATDRVDNLCTTPQIGNEWRQGAGWNAGYDWWAVAMEIDSLCTQGADVVLLGNSITQGFAGERKGIALRPGYDALNKALSGKKWVSAGISGDCTQHLLWRLRNGSYGKSGAKTVFITIGVNNLNRGNDVEDVIEGIKEVAIEAAKQFPTAKIILFGTLPYFNMDAQQQVQTALEQWKKPARVEFIDPSSSFIDDNGEPDEQYFSSDRLHLNEKGYQMWSELIAPLCR